MTLVYTEVPGRPGVRQSLSILFSLAQPSILLIKGSHRARKGGAGIESRALKHEAIYKL